MSQINGVDHKFSSNLYIAQTQPFQKLKHPVCLACFGFSVFWTLDGTIYILFHKTRTTNLAWLFEELQPNLYP